MPACPPVLRRPAWDIRNTLRTRANATRRDWLRCGIVTRLRVGLCWVLDEPDTYLGTTGLTPSTYGLLANPTSALEDQLLGRLQPAAPDIHNGTCINKRHCHVTMMYIICFFRNKTICSPQHCPGSTRHQMLCRIQRHMFLQTHEKRRRNAQVPNQFLIHTNLLSNCPSELLLPRAAACAPHFPFLLFSTSDAQRLQCGISIAFAINILSSSW